MRHKLVMALVGALVGTVVTVAVVFVGFQRRLIYYPGDAVPAAATVGLPDAETVSFTTDDGLTLDAWYVPADGDEVGAVLLLHGNGGTRAGRAPLAAALADRGLATLLVDYRGYGGNPGSPSQEGLLADARAAADALAHHAGVGPERTVYFGESLGSAVAAGLAAERPPAALVLRSPFPDLASVGAVHYRWLPVELALRDRFPTARWLARYDGPTLVVFGGADDLVPPDLSREVVRAAAGPTRSVVVHGANHNDRALLDGDSMLDALTTWLRDATVLDPRS